MKYLRELFKNKDKKSVTNLVTIFVCGIVLLIAANYFGRSLEEKPTEIQEAAPVMQMTKSFEEELELRLEDALALVDGVGKVKVLLTISNGKELVVAEDSQVTESGTTENDGSGGVRETFNRQTQGNKIIVSDNQGSKPLVLKEIQPEIEGVIIVAEGGDDIYVKDTLTKSAVAILGIEPHKVSVLKMK